MNVRSGATVGEEIRCPSCSRLLVLRSGPAITPHFAHRPRQSCRNRPGRAAVPRLRLEQLTLFELEPAAPTEPIPVYYFRPRPAPVEDPAAGAGPRPAVRRRRRRKAWFPRLIRWLKGRPRSL